MFLFFLLGILVGCVGSVMGIGGGIILVPVLLTLFPDQDPSEITATSLFCVALNSIAGSVTYFLKKKIHIPSAVLFSITALPGAWIGVHINSLIDRALFQLIFGFFLLFFGIYVSVRKNRSNLDDDLIHWKSSFNKNLLGLIGSFFIGLLSSVLGLGGGIFHVPFLIDVMQFPAHVAVATSQGLLAVSSSLAAFKHFLNGTLQFDQLYVLFIAFGIVIGAPLGSKLAAKIKGKTILKLLGAALILAGLHLIYQTV